MELERVYKVNILLERDVNENTIGNLYSFRMFEFDLIDLIRNIPIHNRCEELTWNKFKGAIWTVYIALAITIPNTLC